MLEIFKKIFEANPDKSKIVVNGKCLDCGCDVIIEIIPILGGFGFQSGALFK